MSKYFDLRKYVVLYTLRRPVMHVLESLLSELLHQLDQKEDSKRVEAWGRSPLLKEHELLQAAYALLAKRSPNFTFSPLASGAIPLFRQGFFLWGGLPYPQEHAQLGALLAQLNDPQANAMVHFQEATLDHTKRPIASLFRQEEGWNEHSLKIANDSFFKSVGYVPSATVQFADHELGMVSRRTDVATVVCMASGCKSGMGVFLNRDAGILNFGPQLSPFENCSAFGLAGRAQKIDLHDLPYQFTLSSVCHLASPHMRETGFSHIKDSGYSGVWMKTKMEGNLSELSIECTFESVHPLDALRFIFFGKGESCWVRGLHKLSPRSLDRYQGPVQGVTLVGKEGNVHIEVPKGVSHLEVIPLAGDENYWGADFMFTYILNAPKVNFILESRSHQS